jgi:hypothetical protein
VFALAAGTVETDEFLPPAREFATWFGGAGLWRYKRETTDCTIGTATVPETTIHW